MNPNRILYLEGPKGSKYILEYNEMTTRLDLFCFDRGLLASVCDLDSAVACLRLLCGPHKYNVARIC